MSKINTSKTTWDLSPLLAGDDDPKIQKYRALIADATKAFAEKWRTNTDYMTDPATLKEALDELEQYDRLPGNGNEAYYFHLRESLDSIDPKIKAKDSQITDFNVGIINQLQFFWLNLGKIEAAIQSKMLSDSRLGQYRHILEKVFEEAKYQLSEAEEKIMLVKSTSAHSSWVQLTSGFLAKEERKILKDDGTFYTATLESMLSSLSSLNKNVRDSAATALDDILVKNEDLAEAEMNAILGNKKADDEIRGFDRPDRARHLSDDIDTEVVDALVASVTQRFDIPQRFYELKSKLLGLPKMEYYERNIPYGSVEKSYTYEEASELVYDTFFDLDEEFAAIFKRMVENGQLDVYPKKGKRTGAFCTGHFVTHPTYVLLNFTNKLRDVSVIAHEMGHAINNELIKQKQNSLDYGTPLSTAEVASTFIEGFVFNRLIAEADDELRLALLMGKLDDTVSTVTRQTAFYNFETELHRVYRESGYVSKDQIGRIFQKHTAAYVGPVFKNSDAWQRSWLYVGHFRVFFYVYSYTSGSLISAALQAKVRKDKSFVKNVKQFLSAGRSKSPKDIFADMGIDITGRKFWDDGMSEIERLLDETEALAKKLGKI